MRFIFSPIAAVILTGIAGIICISLYLTSVKIKQSSQSVALIENEVANMEVKVAKIEQNAQVATSSTAKEALFRQELLMQRPNEYIVQVPDIEVAKMQKTQEIEALTPWEKWKEVLF